MSKEELIEITPIGLKNKVTLTVRENLRPRTCPELTCKPLIRGWGSSDEQLQKGFSATCYGYCGKKEWKYKEANHQNDFCVCVMTPFKGHIKFVQNFNDIANTSHETRTLTGMLNPNKCKNCDVKGSYETVTHYGGKENAFCRACAVKLGFVIYDEKTKKYETNWDRIKLSKSKEKV